MFTKINKLRVSTGVAVVVAAGVSGYVMQDIPPASTRATAIMPSAPQAALPKHTATFSDFDSQGIGSEFTPSAPVELISEEVTRAATPPVLFFPTNAPIMPGTPVHEALTLVSAGAEAASSPTLTEDDPLLVSQCETGFTAMAARGAMVDLTLEAPCYAGQMIDIFHSGMRFTDSLDADGLLQVSIPAMEEDAFFNALFTDGHTESTDILMLTVSDYNRVALFWKGNAGFNLYALENGALYGESGHVSVETPYSPARGVTGEGGFLAQLGQSITGYHTAIYSYPALLADTGPLPEVSIEVQIIEGNCDSEISATLMQNTRMDTLENVPLVMAVPDCSTIGEYLVLKNLPQDLRIAVN